MTWLNKVKLAHLAPVLKKRGFSILTASEWSNTKVRKIGLTRDDAEALLDAIAEYQSGGGEDEEKEVNEEELQRLHDEREKERWKTRYYIFAGLAVFFAVIYQVLSLVANRPYR